MATINKNFKVKNGLDVSGNTTVEGTITATTFIGDGSGLTNVGSSSGLSAYQIAVNNGFVGTEQQWLDSLVGADGPQGIQGETGAPGMDGLNGDNGINGEDGTDGASAYEIALNNGFVGTEQDWLASLQGSDGQDGQDGDAGAPGVDGLNGMDGMNGLSAYEIALNNGFVGTEQDWLASLQGSDGSDGSDGYAGIDGESAYQIAVNNGFVGTEAQWLASLAASIPSAGPAFRAYIASGQTISSGSQQKVTFGSETFDTNSNFASSRFTPTVEGYYQLNSTVRISGGSSTGETMLVLYKNGTEYSRGTNQQGTEQGVNFYSMQVSDIAVANGSTDYFEIYIQQTSGSSKDTTAGAQISYFSGCMIRGA